MYCPSVTPPAIMEDIILPSLIHHAPNEGSQSPTKTNEAAKRRRLSSFSPSCNSSISWGRRHHHATWLHALGSASIMVFCPLLTIFFWIALSLFHGSLTSTWHAMWAVGPVSFLWNHAPRKDVRVHVWYGVWLLFQAGLYQFLPGKLSFGQLTPAGNLLTYRTNGLFAWVLTHLLFASWTVHGCVDAAIFAKNWEGLLVSVNVYGFLLSGFAYIKAYVSPTLEGDRKFSGKIGPLLFENQALIRF